MPLYIKRFQLKKCKLKSQETNTIFLTIILSLLIIKSPLAEVCCYKCLNKKDFHMKNKIYNPSRRATPWDNKDDILPIETFIRSNYLEYFNHHHKKIIDVNESKLLNSYSPKQCPRCHSSNIKKNGLYASSLQKYYCKDCKKNFNILTGTIFEDH